MAEPAVSLNLVLIAASDWSELDARYWTHCVSTFSSSEPGLMRSPPVCGMRWVGFCKIRECGTSARFTSGASDRPNISIWSLLASASGKCTRVPEATPLVVWQMRQCAASRTGYNLVAKKVGSVAGACARAAGTMIADAVKNKTVRIPGRFMVYLLLLPLLWVWL